MAAGADPAASEGRLLGCGRAWSDLLAGGRGAAAAAVQQWRWAVAQRRRTCAARRIYSRRLQLAALAALRAEAARARARWREACLLDCKHQFMRLAGSFEAWRASALARRALAEREAQLQEARWGRCAGALPCVGAGCAAGFLAASDAEALSSRLATAPAHTRPLA